MSKTPEESVETARKLIMGGDLDTETRLRMAVAFIRNDDRSIPKAYWTELLQEIFNDSIGGETSDGHHTFDELYHYRMLYNAAFCNSLKLASSPDSKPVYWYDVHKSYRHADGELCFGKENYFVVVVQLPTGQVSNHYKGEYWDLFDVPERERAAEWDGHTPAEAADRLLKFLEGKTNGKKT